MGGRGQIGPHPRTNRPERASGRQRNGFPIVPALRLLLTTFPGGDTRHSPLQSQLGLLCQSLGLLPQFLSPPVCFRHILWNAAPGSVHHG
jgi:hypothetical protein